MFNIPLMIDLKDRPALVVGGGKVAARRVETLLEAGARVTVIAPDTRPILEERAREGRIRWHQKSFDSADLADAWVVVAATDDPDVNRSVAKAAGPRRLVNVVDNPSLGNFTVPVTLRRGRLTFAVSTGGASPILARRIRDDLAQRYDGSWEEKVERLYEERERIKGSGLSEGEKRERLARLVEELLRDK